MHHPKTNTAVLDRAATYIWRMAVSDSFTRADAVQRYAYCRHLLFREAHACHERSNQRWVTHWLRVYIDMLCSDELGALADCM